ncbi:MAG TPA: alkaline phosphatase family protein [Polyangiales bacterium]|nr:alkaline phosphatase family protein [Polyangiales bacterium]
MLFRKVCTSLLLLAAGCAGSVPRGSGGTPQSLGGPALVVLISVDQLRADLPLKLMSRFGNDGFRRLYEQGVVYDQALYAHSATETAVGHATLGTGALPRDHGIVGNDWVDNGKKVYATGDESAALVGASSLGMSPTRLLAETVGDVLVRTRPNALLRSVSGKDRAAILMNGRKGVAYWLEDGTSTFVTSQAYLSQLPRWVETFDGRQPAEAYRDQPWTPYASANEYHAPEAHVWEGKRACGDVGCRFPHSLSAFSGEGYTKAIKNTPYGDALTLAFVRELLENEPLGRDDVSDVLNLSFSSTDYIQHTFGPESREAEDNLLRLDRVLGSLFALLDDRVGRGRYVLVLSADHGACESPEYLKSQGVDADHLDAGALVTTVNEGLRARFNVGVDLVQEFVNPSLVLNEARIASLSLDQEAVEQAAVDLAVEQPGVHAAFSRSAVLAGKGSHPFLPRIANSTHRERSGHVYIVPKEHWLLANPPARMIAMHGSPWPYDAHVPVVVWGTGAPAQHVTRPVDPRDIAPTISTLLRIPTPNKSTGKPLTEALP